MADPTLRRLWGLARHAVVFELRLYRSLARWLARRPDHGGPDDQPVGYARTVTPVMWLWILASAAELPLVHVLVPWHGVRIALLVVGVWGLVWMVGLLASLSVYPHLLGPERLRVRYGASHDISLPWDAVASVSSKQEDLDSTVWTLQPQETDEGTQLRVGTSGKVNVHLRLRRPTVVSTAKGDLEVVRLSFFADEPRDVATRVRERLAARS